MPGDGPVDEEQQSEPTELVIYRCTECGKTSVSIGWLHAHINKHLSIGPLGLIPIPWKFGRPKHQMKHTEVLRVDEYSKVGLDEVTVYE